MTSQRTRRSFLALGAGATAFAAVGCGNDGGGGAGGKQVEVVSWWTGGGESVGYKLMQKDFEKRFKGYKFKDAAIGGGSGTQAQAKLAGLLQAGNPPDSFQGHAGAELIDYIKPGYLDPLDDFYKKHKLASAYPEQLIEQITYQEHIYSVPVNIHRSNVLWYSPKVLAAANISAPPTSVEDFIAQCKAIKAKTGKPSLGLGQQWTADHLLESVLLGTLKADKYNELWKNGDWAGADVTQALKNFAQLVDQTGGAAASGDWQVAGEKVVNAEVAYNIMGDWAFGYYLELGKKPETDFKWAASPGTDGTYMWLSDSFVLPKKAKNREAALKWLEECSSKQGQDLFNPKKGSIPARKDADASLYKSYLKWALEEWKKDDLAGSFWHGVVANNKWKGAIDTSVGLFLKSKDVSKLQSGLVDAAKQFRKA